MIDWMVDVEDVTCPVGDIRKVSCSDPLVQSEWCEGKGEC